MTPAEHVALSWYSVGFVCASRFVMLLTTSRAMLSSATRPALVAPDGGTRRTVRVTPAGMLVLIWAVTFFGRIRSALTVYVVELFVNVAGCDHAIAPEMVIVPGVPVTLRVWA